MMCASTRASKSTSNPSRFSTGFLRVLCRVDASASRALGAGNSERGQSSNRGRLAVGHPNAGSHPTASGHPTVNVNPLSSF